MDDGRPFFVMEYVEGVSITQYCEDERLTTTERLELVRQVCDGLQHAHQKAIIHRDIKPSNVIVTLQDGVAVPKIIDFGVAKAESTPITDNTFMTELGQVIGTPEYMSPEQAELSGDPVDTRTDIYSLGVVMYELLVGVLPLDPVELRKAGFQEILRRIREETPPRPSTRLSTLGEESQELGLQRRTTAHRLSSQLRGDLDWITMKALDKDRGRRYSSAAEMSADIERYLRHEPVSAGPPSAAYRCSKFVRRHRIGVSFAVLAVSFLVVFAVTTSVQAQRVAGERDKAFAEADGARRIAKFMTGIFKEADPGRARGADVTAREILDAGAKQIETLDEQPLTQASLMEAIGSVYGVMGLFDEGQVLLERALEFREKQNDGGEATELALAGSLDTLGALFTRSGEPDRAMPLAQRSVEIRERLLGDHEDLADSLNTLGNALWNSGNLDDAEVAHDRALTIRRAVFGPVHESVGSSLHNVASLRFIGGDLPEAEQLYLQALDVALKSRGPGDYGTATTQHTLAMVFSIQGRFAEALPLEEGSLATREAVLGPDHPHVALSLTTLAEILIGMGEAERAEPYARRAVVIGEAAWGADYGDVWWMKRGHAAALNRLGRHGEALEIMRPLVARIEAAPRQVEMGLHLAELAACYFGLDQLENAELNYLRAIEIGTEEASEPDPDVAVFRLGLARVEHASGRTADAEANYEAAIRTLEEQRSAGDPDRIRGLLELADLLEATGRETRAAEFRSQAAEAGQ